MHNINEKKSCFTALFYNTHPLGVKASMAFSCHDLGQTLVDCAKIEKKNSTIVVFVSIAFVIHNTHAYPSRPSLLLPDDYHNNYVFIH